MTVLLDVRLIGAGYSVDDRMGECVTVVDELHHGVIKYNSSTGTLLQ